MSRLRSNIAPLVERFIDYRNASGCWNQSYEKNIRLFDHFCADHYPVDTVLSQEMVDCWCAKRDTETNSSRESRIRVVRGFVDYLQNRNLTNILQPAVLKRESKAYIPYAFKSEELLRFFHECDHIKPYYGRMQSVIRRLTIPVFFRLLYSSGLRTTEARFLRKEDVDMVHGIVDIRKSKGRDQHYVVLHDTMKHLLLRYEREISKLQSARTYFFQSYYTCSHYSKEWIEDNFRTLWKQANGSGNTPVAYDIRHLYAITNINSWIDDGFEFSDKLHYLSKSMGHRSIDATYYYYSIIPRLADTLRTRTEKGFNTIVPEVIADEE